MEWLKWLLDALLAPITAWRTTRRERRQWTWQRKAEFLAQGMARRWRVCPTCWKRVQDLFRVFKAPAAREKRAAE